MIHTTQIGHFVDASVFKAVANAAADIGVEAYVVGGYVRDCLLGRPKPKDLDFVCVGSGIKLAKRLAENSPGAVKVTVFKHFGTAQVRLFGYDLEFVGARKESYSQHSRNPAVEDGTLQDDQNRRDFTINAMAISLNKDTYGQLVDPFNGINDLKEGVLRTPLDPLQTFSDDPLRMLRATRFAAQLDFYVHPEALKAIEETRTRIAIISRERIADELTKTLQAQRPSVGLAILYQTGLLAEIFPELVALKGVDEVDGQTHKDNFYHTLQVVDNLCRNSDNVWLRWAALLHDIGKPVTKRFVKGIGWTFHGHEFLGSKMVPRIFKNLKLPQNEKMRFVQKIVKLSSRPIALVEDVVTDSAVRRLLFEAGDDIDDLMILCEADITTKNNKKRDRYLRNFAMVREKLAEVEKKDRLRNWQPPVDGEEIMNVFGIAPGREVGIIKQAIREAILEGTIPNEYQAAYTYMLALGTEIGLTRKQEKN